MEKVLPKVLYEDKNLLVVDKPAGIVVARENKQQNKSLMDVLIQTRPELKKIGKVLRYGLVHRLDKDASGVLLIAKDKLTLEFLQTQFQGRKVKKIYFVLVYGKLEENEGEIQTLIGRDKNNRLKQRAYLPIEPEAKKIFREAITFWRVKERFQDYSLLEVFPKTGRKHQIRVHMAFLGYPVVGDKLYAPQIKHPIKRLFLHCQKIIIQLPNKSHREFFAPLPQELRDFLNKLK